MTSSDIGRSIGMQPLAIWGHTVGNTDPDLRLTPGYMDKDGNVIPFASFVQYIGPPVAYYFGPDHRYQYQVFAWQSDDPAKIVARIEALAAQMRERGANTIIWRTKPEFQKMPDGKPTFYCRFHTLPYVQFDGEKPEGEPFPEA
jgi:hypothetical protein